MKNTQVKGFDFKNRKIYFIDAQGKDVSFNRWRVNLYYARNFALTHFLNSQTEYEAFINEHKADCYTDFEEFQLQNIEHPINGCFNCAMFSTSCSNKELYIPCLPVYNEVECENYIFND
jgi:hypothetical protein